MNKTMNHLFVSVAIALCVSATAFPQAQRTPEPVSSRSVARTVRSERVTIAIEGMYCDSCAAGIKSMLKRTSGVVSAEVSYQRKEAVVDYDPQKTTPEKIIEASTS